MSLAGLEKWRDGKIPDEPIGVWRGVGDFCIIVGAAVTFGLLFGVLLRGVAVL